MLFGTAKFCISEWSLKIWAWILDTLFVLYCDREGRRFLQRMPTLAGLPIDWIGTKLNDDFVQLDGT